MGFPDIFIDTPPQQQCHLFGPIPNFSISGGWRLNYWHPLSTFYTSVCVVVMVVRSIFFEYSNAGLGAQTFDRSFLCVFQVLSELELWQLQLARKISPGSLSICRFDGWLQASNHWRFRLQASNHWRFDGWWFQASSHCACREACHELGIDWIRKVSNVPKTNSLPLQAGPPKREMNHLPMKIGEILLFVSGRVCGFCGANQPGWQSSHHFEITQLPNYKSCGVGITSCLQDLKIVRYQYIISVYISIAEVSI